LNSTSVALCKLAGVDPDHVIAVWYSHKVGEIPSITFQVDLIDVNGSLLVDDGDIRTALRTFEWREIGTV
jgi:hypothetical protein